MCIDCWEYYKDDAIINDRVRKAVVLIRELYLCHSAGGNLHVVLDDWNLDSIEACKSYIDNEEDEEQKEIELRVYEHIRTLTEEELATALAIDDGFIQDEN